MFDYIEHIVIAIISSFFAAVGWLIRTVLTNQKQIALLQEEIKTRDNRRTEDRKILLDMKEELKDDMREIREDIEGVQSEILQIWKNK